MVEPTRLGQWAALEVTEVVGLFRRANFRWWLAGGHALEAHIGASWRAHEDIDVGILRADAPQLVEVLAGWDIHLAHNGVLTPWDGQPLPNVSDSVSNLWCRPSPDTPWALDILLGEGDNTEWIYRRNTTVRRPWSEAILNTVLNVPYLAPDIQLLFKSKDSRPKDEVDAAIVIPLLATGQRSWLAHHLPSEHEWQRIIAEHRARLALNTETSTEASVVPLAAGKSSTAWKSGDGAVARVPIPNSGRRVSFQSESCIGELLAKQGHPVSRWATLSIDGAECSVGEFLEGAPIGYDTHWPASFAQQLASVLRELHQLPASGWGPLEDRSDKLAGTSESHKRGIVDRWFHAPIWPFDDSDFCSHALVSAEPELASRIMHHKETILAASDEPFGVVHSDLHNQHLLQSKGRLSGLLDFGDAFVGSTAWDFALIIWYYGRTNAELFARAYEASAHELERGAQLAVAVGCYKAAKNEDDPVVVERLRTLLG